MAVITNEFAIKLYNAKNSSLEGTVFIQTYAINNGTNSTEQVYTDNDDPHGAVTYVIAVILFYGLAIVFLIASHVFAKKKEERLESQIRSAEKYFELVGNIREKSDRESYKKLKHSIIPVVAKSTARDLISRRKSFAPILARAGLQLEIGGVCRRLSEADPSLLSKRLTTDDKDESEIVDQQYMRVPTRRAKIISKMPSISEEESEESTEGSTNVKCSQNVIELNISDQNVDSSSPDSNTSFHYDDETCVGLLQAEKFDIDENYGSGNNFNDNGSIKVARGNKTDKHAVPSGDKLGFYSKGVISNESSSPCDIKKIGTVPSIVYKYRIPSFTDIHQMRNTERLNGDTNFHLLDMSSKAVKPQDKNLNFKNNIEYESHINTFTV